MSLVNRIELLETQLLSAKDAHKLAKAELRKAQQKEDRTSGKVQELKALIAYARLENWGRPDLSIMLDARESPVYYDATAKLATNFGMGILGEWADTNQLNLTFGMNRIETGAIERLAKGIRYFAPGIKRIRGGWARFSIQHREEGCAWQLHFSPVRGNAKVVKLFHCIEQENFCFTSLEAALAYIEKYLWVGNVIDAVIDVPAIARCSS